MEESILGKDKSFGVCENDNDVDGQTPKPTAWVQILA